MSRDGDLRHRFPRCMRLRGRQTFLAVYREGRRRDAGPLTLHVRPNGRDRLRLGLSVSRRVGSAVRRNRVKRLLREAFRLDQHGLPRGYDVVVSVRRHEPLPLETYRAQLGQALRALDRAWSTRTDGPRA